MFCELPTDDAFPFSPSPSPLRAPVEFQPTDGHLDLTPPPLSSPLPRPRPPSSMSTFPGLVQPKRKRNPKALQLSAEALSPRSDSFSEESPAPLLDSSSALQPSSVDDAAPDASLAAAPAAAPAAVGPLGGQTASKISRKKPAGLDISKSIPTRPAPAPSATSTPTDRVKRSSTSTPRSRTLSGEKPARVTYQQKLSEQLASLHLGGEGGKTKVGLKADDLKVVGDLGCGNGGTVAKVLHGPSGLYMARKVRFLPLLSPIERPSYGRAQRLTSSSPLSRRPPQLVLIDAKPAVRKQILRELQIMHDCSSAHIVSFYGAFMADPHICICMEYMDRGCVPRLSFVSGRSRSTLTACLASLPHRSLDNVYRKHGAIDVQIVGAIAHRVLEGLTYLYDVHRIIHRGARVVAYRRLVLLPPGVLTTVQPLADDRRQAEQHPR